MKKQVILSEDDYESLLDILVDSVNILDSYVARENRRKDIDCHIVDSPRCDKNIKGLYSKLLWMDEDIRGDLLKRLGNRYFDRFPESVLNEIGGDF